MALIDPALRELLEGGAVILVATRNAAMHPFVTRGWGAEVHADGAAVSVQVGRAASPRTLADLEDNGCLSIGFGDPITSRGVQLKGYCTEVAEPDAADVDRAHRQFLAFAAKVEPIGVPRHIVQLLFSVDLVRITLTPRELFDQTPGVGAGKRL